MILLASILLIGLGVGLVMPGLAACPALLTASDEQGGLTGQCDVRPDVRDTSHCGSRARRRMAALPAIVGSAITAFAHSRFLTRSSTGASDIVSPSENGGSAASALVVVRAARPCLRPSCR